MNRESSFMVGDWYHCYNHSVDGRIAFVDEKDYVRFLELLYLANDSWPLKRNDLGQLEFEDVLAIPRGKTLVSIGAFCLMPDSFNFALRETSEGGITAFMRKVGTGYTLYFNSRHKRAGNLFLRPFRSHKVTNESLTKNLVSYIHSRPAVLYEPQWKSNHVVDPQFLEEHLTAYPYSSLGVYAGTQTRNAPIIAGEIHPSARKVSLQKMLQEARTYSIDSGIP